MEQPKSPTKDDFSTRIEIYCQAEGLFHPIPGASVPYCTIRSMGQSPRHLLSWNESTVINLKPGVSYQLSCSFKNNLDFFKLIRCGEAIFPRPIVLELGETCIYTYFPDPNNVTKPGRIEETSCLTKEPPKPPEDPNLWTKLLDFLKLANILGMLGKLLKNTIR